MPARKQVSFGTFNLLNINLPGRRIYSDSDGWDQATYDRKVEWTGKMLTGMRSDVWGFQELWHHAALEEVSMTRGC